MRRLALSEYTTSTAPVTLDVEQRDRLAELVPSVTITPARGLTGSYHLTPASQIGVVQVGDLTIEIRPKLPIKRVLFLVSYAIDRGTWQDEVTDLGPASLVDAVAPAFISHVRRAFRRGLLQGYRTEEDALATVRGRIRFDEQIRRRLGVFPPVEVRFDEFTEDFEPNRLIKAALERLSRAPLRSTNTRRSLIGLGRLLERVQLVNYPASSVPAIAYNRHNEHYRPAVELARLILTSSSFELGQRGVPATTFLIDMNKVFEDFVVIALRDSLRLDPHSFPQGSQGHDLRLDDDRRVRLRPDISWWDDGECVFVGDVKYKRISVAGYQHGDLYQLLAYSIAASTPGGVLIYAQGEHPAATYTVRHTGKELHVVTLPLTGEPDQVLSEIHALALRINALRSRPRQLAA